MEKLELLPFQKEGVELMRARRDVLLADEMGLGKTIQVIGLINSRPDISNVLIVCPASIKLNWEKEIRRWSTRNLMTQVANGAFPMANFPRIVIINYEQVNKFKNEIRMENFDLLVLDESHYLKNPKAQRTKAVLGDRENNLSPIRARHRVFLTGTPVLNRPKELWTTVKALDPAGLGRDWLNFHIRYCNGHQTMIGGRKHWDIDGAANLSELNQRLRKSIMIRRLKEQVLDDLPDKRRQLILLSPSSVETKTALKAELDLLCIEKELDDLRSEVESLSADQASEAYKKAVQKLRTREAIAFTETSKVRHATALAKVPQVVEHLKDVLEAEEKIVVFAYHHDVVDALFLGLDPYLECTSHSLRGRVVQMDGRTDLEGRQRAVRAFQEWDKVRVIIGSIPVLGVGWTLTAASYVAFAELDWTPGNLIQAEDRLHRIGQKNSVLVQHLMLDGSFDAHMAHTILEKTAVITAAVGG